MRLTELPVFLSAKDPNTTMLFVNPDSIFFVVEADVPTPLVDKDQNPIAKHGTIISPLMGTGLLIDMLLEDVLSCLAEDVTRQPAEGQKEKDGNGESKPIKCNTKRVCKGPKIRSRRQKDN